MDPLCLTSTMWFTTTLTLRSASLSRKTHVLPASILIENVLYEIKQDFLFPYWLDSCTIATFPAQLPFGNHIYTSIKCIVGLSVHGSKWSFNAEMAQVLLATDIENVGHIWEKHKQKITGIWHGHGLEKLLERHIPCSRLIKGLPHSHRSLSYKKLLFHPVPLHPAFLHCFCFYNYRTIAIFALKRQVLPCFIFCRKCIFS